MAEGRPFLMLGAPQDWGLDTGHCHAEDIIQSHMESSREVTERSSLGPAYRCSREGTLLPRDILRTDPSLF